MLTVLVQIKMTYHSGSTSCMVISILKDPKIQISDPHLTSDPLFQHLGAGHSGPIYFIGSKKTSLSANVYIENLLLF